MTDQRLINNRMKTNLKNLLGIAGLAVGLAATEIHAGTFALIADGANHNVAEYYVSGTAWTFVTNFVDSTTPLPDGSGGFLNPITSPTSVVQDQQGRLYVSDQGVAGANRILRFSTNGTFIDLVGANGLNGFNAPGSGIDDMTVGPDGNVYGTLAFGTGNNQILKYDVATNGWSVFSATNKLSTPRGVAFGPDGNLYVCSRGTANMLVFGPNGVLLRTNATFSGTFTTTPMGLRWDAVGNRFICTAGNGNSVICACTTNGVLTLITGTNPSGGPGASKSSLGALANGTNVFYVAFINPGHVYLCNNTNTASVTTVDTLATPALNNPTFMNFVTGFGIGSLQSVALSLARTNMVLGTFQQAQFVGNYLAQAGVDITTDPKTTYLSSNTNVLTVSASGRLTAIGTGTATITASNSSLSDSKTITVAPLATQLIHRYSFNETDGALSATDSVGGTPQWDAPVYMIPGIAGGVVTNDTSLNPGGFVRIPEGAITNRDALTFEAWASFGTNGNWARLFDFGTDNGAGTGSTNTLFVSPRTSVGTTRMSLTTRGVTEFAEVAGTLDNRANVHIVAVFNPLAGYLKLYLNGALAAQNLNVTRDLAGFDDSFNYLGQSQFWASDAYLNGAINEFRIYSGVLAGTNVAINAAAGPDRFVSDPGALQSGALSVTATMLEQGQQTVTFLGNFANVTNVNLSTFGPAFASSDTNVLMVTAAGFVKAAGPGTATITASYGGKSDSQAITVYPLPVAGVLVSDQGHNRVLRFDAKGTNWTLAGIFAQGSYDGTNLTTPTALAQDHAGNIYIGEAAGGRILKFSDTGTFLSVLAREGVDYVGAPDGMAVGPDGKLYFSTPFTGAKVIYQVDLATSAITTIVPTTDGASYAFVNPRGIAFGGDGNLYVANRGGFSEGGRSIHEFDPVSGFWIADLVGGLNSPNALSYDALNNRFLASVDSAANVIAIATNGTVSYVLDDAIGHAITDVWNIVPNVYFSDFSGGGVWAVTAPNASVLVAGGMLNPGRMLVLPPRLKLALAGGTATLSWAADAVGYSLQVTPSLAPADWQSVTNTPVILGIEKQVTLPVGASANFYRLKK